MELEERFWSKVDKSSNCWVWTASFRSGDYGQFRVEGKIQLAHRVSYVIEHGSIPDGLCVCHTCDNPSCVKPKHLFLGTRNDNNQDAIRKGRNARGRMVPQAKLTEKQVKAIRLDTRPRKEIAKEYGLHYNTISKIRTGKRWGHIWKHIT